jgi:archaeosine synthase beta-subunit
MQALKQSRSSDAISAGVRTPASRERAAHVERRLAFKDFEPHAVFLEQERSNSSSILEILTVLLRNGECPWRCIYCDLWKETTLTTVSAGAIAAQIDYALRQPGAATAKQIKIYNAGSFFDPKAIPCSDHPKIVHRLKRFERAIVECHPAFAARAPEFRQALEDTELEVAMGLEVADDALLARLQKRMTLSSFRAAAALLQRNGIALRAFVMVKPPFVRSEPEALTLATRSIDFAFECGAQVITLIPARFGPERLNALAAAGEFAPPALATTEQAFDYGLSRAAGRVFVDLWDAANFRACMGCRSQRVERLRAMNLGQAVLPPIHCSCAT